MRARTTLVVLGFLAASAAVVWADTVVLKAGPTIEVEKAEVEGGRVLLTLANGRMQAYPVEEVDLAASGLLPTEDAQGAAATPRKKLVSLSDAVSSEVTEARLKVTDEDVLHVIPGSEVKAEGAEGEGEQKPGAATASLLVSGLSQQITGSMIDLSGTVKNNGGNPVSSITLEALATDKAGNQVGRGTTVISSELAPDASLGFTMGFPVSGEVADVRVRASAVLADFDLTPVQPPPQPSPQPSPQPAQR